MGQNRGRQGTSGKQGWGHSVPAGRPCLLWAHGSGQGSPCRGGSLLTVGFSQRGLDTCALLALLLWVTRPRNSSPPRHLIEISSALCTLKSLFSFSFPERDFDSSVNSNSISFLIYTGLKKERRKYRTSFKYC